MAFFPQFLFMVGLVSFFALDVRANLEIPKGIKAEDRRPALEILGGGSQLKLIGDPYPLGGYWGIDIGLSRETIGVSGLKTLGNGTGEQGDVGVWALTFGKGLYYDVDMFLQFVPFGQQERVSSFGGGARWLFYEMDSLPVFFSVQAGANSASFQNLINLSNQSADLIASFSRRDITFYAGAGYFRSTAIFLGGAGGVTVSGNTELESMLAGRVIAGLSYRWDNVYVAGQLDRSFDTNYSVKAGYRF